MDQRFPFIVLAFVSGLCLGSFLNVVLYRLPRGMSIVAPRSFCPNCRHQVRWYDNVPVLSYLILRGKCRDCGAKISWRYPAVELVTGLVITGIWLVIDLLFHF